MKILLCTKSLESGGVEVTLINLIDKLLSDGNDITLLLLNNIGQYKDTIDRRVHIVELPFINQKYNFYRKSYQRRGLTDRIVQLYQQIMRKIFGYRVLYRTMSRKVKDVEGEYDIAIDYHGYGYFGTVYVLDHVTARKKITFVHDEKMDWINRVKNRFNEYDYAFCVSKSCAMILSQRFNVSRKKITVFDNIINTETIKAASREKIAWNYSRDDTVIVTVGRLEYQKGTDLLIKAAALLKARGVSFKLIIIGTGSLYSEMRRLIKIYNLDDEIMLKGFVMNPYPYISKSNIYIQTSRHEGYGMAIAEARVLCKPIIATDINCVKEQITDGENGFIVNMTPEDICDKIEYLIHNRNEMRRVEKKLKNELKELESGKNIELIYKVLDRDERQNEE